MQSSFRLGNIFGIDIGIHYTWLFVFALVTWSLAALVFPQTFQGWSTAAYWTVGAIAALLLFVSVLVHELAHSLVAKREGLPVASITLFIFGGVSNIQKEATRPRDEFLMAFVGPLSSLVIGVVMTILALLLSNANQQVFAIVSYLAGINILLAAFNLVPAFPLDGGRVLRAILWWWTGSMMRATRIASIAGQVFAYLIIFIGLLFVFRGDIIGGLWLVFIGWFLNNAAESSYKQLATQQLLRGIPVRNIMTKDLQTTSPDITVRELIERYILPGSIRALPVVRDSRMVGLVTLSDVQHVPQEEWDNVRVEEIMTPREKLHVLTPRDDINMALESLGEQDLNQLPVVDDGRVIGMVTRGHIIRFMQVREELGVRK
ncbi:MAG: site-2 protease family protein [Chloroflexi bacterium]|nr:site-2 protease family protein [Chloroflexota bacterium]